jgi:two-component system response regulator MprA
MSEIPADSGRRKRILVIDDDPETARLLRTWFKGRDYDIHDAANAVEGLKLAVRSNPDIILLDIRMPGMEWTAWPPRGTSRPMRRPVASPSSS